jgi:uncharacterized iron-regulated membrane protein
VKLSRHVFTTSWNVHAWAGVVAALVLHVMFLTGALTLWKPELELWQEPLSQLTRKPQTYAETLDFVVSKLGHVPDDMWLSFPEGSHGVVSAAVFDGGANAWRYYTVDAASGRLFETREGLGEFVYHLHFLWHDAAPIFYYVAGLLSVGLLLALGTGLVIHLKDIVRQFHQFRATRAERVVASDLHKVLGVMGLPFQIFYAYTGALFVLAPLFLAAFQGPVFGGDAGRAQAFAFGLPPLTAVERGAASSVLPADELVRRARQAQPGLVAEAVNFRFHGATNGAVQVHGDVEGLPFGHATVQVRETDGSIIATHRPETALNGRLQRWLLGVHLAHFGGPATRVLFTLLALATCVTLLSGNWIWLSRRQHQANSLGYHVLARLTVGAGAGSILATGALFFASRTLPLDLPRRLAFEEASFFLPFSACIVGALFCSRPRKLWAPLLALSAVLTIATPLVAGRIAPAGILGSGERIPGVVGVDVTLLAVGLCLALGAAHLHRRMSLAAAPLPLTTDTPSLAPDHSTEVFRHG